MDAETRMTAHAEHEQSTIFWTESFAIQHSRIRYQE